MLRALQIRDYTLIDELTIGFDGGLNIITGETGAGKSILVGALKLMLGERASTDVIRKGKTKAILEGEFDMPESPRIRALLHEQGYDLGDRLILRREITASQSRGFINDSPATMQLMREVAGYIIDLHGQHEHQSLLRVETHIDVLDNFGGLGTHVETYRTRYQQMEQWVRERRKLLSEEKELRQQKELIAFQIREIDEVAPQAGEDEALDAECRVLENAERLFGATQSLYHVLYEAENAVYDRIVVARNELSELAQIDTPFQDALQEIKSAEVTIAELTKFLQDYNARIVFDPERLASIRARLSALNTLKRKYGGTLTDVLAHRAKIGETWELAANFDEAIARVDKKIIETAQHLAQAAELLSQKRKETAKCVETGIQAELAELGIPHAQFDVRFQHQTDAKGWIRLHGQRYAAFPNGMDQVEFHISTNLGETPKPLAKTASGGEISRIMLALKSILAKNERLPILVFDEIDAGISGRIAGKVGESMRNLGQFHQIIAITHLPQIAAMGDAHFFVEKEVIGERTRTSIRRLASEERVQKIAAMFSGDDISASALESARALLASNRS